MLELAQGGKLWQERLGVYPCSKGQVPYLAARFKETLVFALDEEALQHTVLEAHNVGLANPCYL